MFNKCKQQESRSYKAKIYNTIKFNIHILNRKTKFTMIMDTVHTKNNSQKSLCVCVGSIAA